MGGATRAGYNKATMSGIAARAGASKPVVYRRWRSQPELVLVALKRFSVTVEAPDTGSVRTDLMIFLGRILDILELLPDGAVRGLIADTYDDPDLFDDVRTHLAGSRVHEITRTILRRGLERGEVPPREWPARVVRLPIDLLRSEYLLSREPMSAEAVAGIVDDVFLPLVRAT
ncbi:TetR/AcrR family transcriptional regulator [Pseudonocardia endophytica]|uniref:TetR/AcrR family transcriptional regulator n=1 Tax=Pseudonocardia endophytica TaxID=401976 RepID=UPI002436D7BF|nr:TetR/AcrR family transcriptional regulator [Pseudonocardia endophytica]